MQTLTKIVRGLLVRVAITGSCAFAPNIAHAQPVPVIDLPAANAKSKVKFSSVQSVFEFPNGSVAVNDTAALEMVLLDRNFAQSKVIFDTAATVNTYARIPTPIVECNCDELWFPDVEARTLMAYSESAKQTREVFKPGITTFVRLSASGGIADTLGHFFYRGWAPPNVLPGMPPRQGRKVSPDSTPVLRANIETGKVDTVVRLLSLRATVQYNLPTENGTPGPRRMWLDVLAPVDEWVALADGSVAVVRGHDYHVDWVGPDTKVQASLKLPFDFKPLSDGDKSALFDEARKAELVKHRREYDRIVSFTQNRKIALAKPPGEGSSVPTQQTAPEIGDYVELVFDDVLQRIPDTYPSILNGAVKADLEGNVWIRPTRSAESRAGELVYDVVARERGQIARVRLPVGKSIAGFGRNGAVYLVSRDAGGMWLLERTKLPSKL